MKKALFEIGSILRHKETGQKLLLKRYGTQMIIGMSIRTSRSITKQKPNFNIFYGQDIETSKKIKGKTKEFEL